MQTKEKTPYSVIISGSCYDNILTWIDTTQYRHDTSKSRLTKEQITCVIYPMISYFAKEKSKYLTQSDYYRITNVEICQKMVAIYLLWVSETTETIDNQFNNAIQNILRRLMVVDDDTQISPDINNLNFNDVLEVMRKFNNATAQAIIDTYFTYLTQIGTKMTKSLEEQMRYVMNSKNITSTSSADASCISITKLELENIYDTFKETQYRCGTDGWHPTKNDLESEILPRYFDICKRRQEAISNKNNTSASILLQKQKTQIIYIIWLVETDDAPDAEFVKHAQLFLKRKLLIS